MQGDAIQGWIRGIRNANVHGADIPVWLMKNNQIWSGWVEMQDEIATGSI